MRKLSEIKNEDALETLANLIDPIIELAQDEDFKKMFRAGKRSEAIKCMIKSHKRAALEILAALDNEPIETYSISVIQIPIKLIEVFNDKDLLDFFQSQGLMDLDASFGSATENIEEIEEQ